MKIKEFIKELQKYNENSRVLLGSDEELNIIFTDIQTENYEDENSVVIWGNSGSGLNG